MFSKDGLIRERRAVFIAALVPVGMDSKLRTRYNYREAGYKMKTKHQADRNRLQSYCSYTWWSGIGLIILASADLVWILFHFLHNVVSVMEFNWTGTVYNFQIPHEIKFRYLHV